MEFNEHTHTHFPANREKKYRGREEQRSTWVVIQHKRITCGLLSKQRAPSANACHHCQSYMVLYNSLKYSKTVSIFPELLEESQSQMEKPEITNKQKHSRLLKNKHFPS